MWLPCKKMSDILQNPGILWFEWGWTGLSAKNKIRVWMWKSVDSVILAGSFRKTLERFYSPVCGLYGLKCRTV